MVDIQVQPTHCSISGEAFTEANHLVVLKSGVALCRKIVEKNCVSESGFVKCPISEYAYSVKNRNDVFAQKTLEPAHVEALNARCRTFVKEIEQIRDSLDYVQLYEYPEFDEAEAKMDFLQREDENSYPEDESDDEFTDFSSFEASEYALILNRLRRLKTFLEELRSTEQSRRKMGEKTGKPWADPAWRPEPNSREEALASAARAKRAQRKAEREERDAARKARSGSNQAVHNVHVLNKQIPKKWLLTNPNTPKPADWEEKERAKQGWLTVDEQDELDEEEAEKLTAQRIAEWRSKRSPVPQIFGSVRRQRWAERFYRLARQTYYINNKIKSLDGNERQQYLWENLLEDFKNRVAGTRTRVEQRIEKAEVQGPKAGQAAKRFFIDAEQIGVTEVENEIIAKKKAAEEAKRREEEAAEKARIAEEKARLKAEAEARGEEWVDPDEGDEDEDDE